MSEQDLNPLQSEIAALRYETRALAYASLASGASNDMSRDDYLDRMFEAQANADSLGHHYRVILGAKAEVPV